MKNSFDQKIVISAVNLTEGGGRVILLSLLKTLSLDERFLVIAIVHDKLQGDLIRSPNIKYLEASRAKKSWFNRVLYEYIFARTLSKRLAADIWFSLHDMTPNIIAKKKYVYCHNIAPFYSFNPSDLILDPKFALFVLFYKWIYRINIKNNNAVFVQQCWIADKFADFFNIDNCVVALPEESPESKRIIAPNFTQTPNPREIIFFYPTLPRTYKNLEIIFESVNLLKKTNVTGYKVIITASINENKYINHLISKYGKPDEIEFCGRLTKDQINSYYIQSDILLFPSKLETWGLPIREAIVYNLPLLLANHEYSRSTSYGYNKVGFFDMDSPTQLSTIMKDIVSNSNYEIFKPNNTLPSCKNRYQELVSWSKLLDYIHDEQPTI